MTLSIWHTEKHDDFTVTKIQSALYFDAAVKKIIKDGGFQSGNAWVPWHRISYIEASVPAATESGENVRGQEGK